jgi:hypothetical protein
MFQLIITVIAVALFVALVLSGIFFGGEAYSNAKTEPTRAVCVHGSIKDYKCASFAP